MSKRILCFLTISLSYLCNSTFSQTYVTVSGQQTVTGNKNFTGTFYGFNSYSANWGYGEGMQTDWLITHNRLDITASVAQSGQPMLYISRPDNTSNLNSNGGAVLLAIANSTLSWGMSPAIGDAVLRAEGSGSLLIGAASGNIKFFNLPTFNGSNLATQSWVTSKNYITPSSISSGFIPKIGTGNTILNSILYETGGNVGIGTTTPVFSPNTAKFFAVENTSANNRTEIGIGANATSITGNIGTLSFYNRAITGTTEKRNAIIASMNDGAINSGNIIFSTANAGTISEKVRIDKSGNVGIGTSATGPYKLAVEGKIGAREIKVTLANPWADYVFNESYQLRSLYDVEKIYTGK